MPTYSAAETEQASQECSVSTGPDSNVDNTSDCEDTVNENTPFACPAHRESECVCSCPCCTNFNIAHQPTDLLAKSKTPQKSFDRSIQPAWCSKHPWISVCISSYKIFCHVCCSASKQGLITKPSYIPFVEGGFSNWKKALQRFSSHEKSGMHKEAVTKLVSKSKAVNVSTMLSKQYDAEKKNNRDMFKKLLHCIQYLARQGISFRGHHEDSIQFEGNLYQ